MKRTNTGVELTHEEAKLIAHLLKEGADEFSNHTCGDFDLGKHISDIGTMIEMVQAFEVWNSGKRSDELAPTNVAEWLPSWCVMSMMSNMLMGEIG